jgi:hypothetical protein
MTSSSPCDVQIEDLRKHPAETVLALKDVLCAGAKIIPDPKRKDLYEVRSGTTVYYIHVSPVTGKVLLLATWPIDGGEPGSRRAA